MQVDTDEDGCKRDYVDILDIVGDDHGHHTYCGNDHADEGFPPDQGITTIGNG